MSDGCQGLVGQMIEDPLTLGGNLFRVAGINLVSCVRRPKPSIGLDMITVFLEIIALIISNIKRSQKSPKPTLGFQCKSMVWQIIQEPFIQDNSALVELKQPSAILYSRGVHAYLYSYVLPL